MSTTLLMTSSAAAAGTGSSAGGAAFFVQMFPLIAVGVIFYLLMIRPQQRRLKEHQATIDAVKKGDDVITAGGIRGRVTKVGEDEAEVEIASGVRVRVVKSTLSQVLNASSKAAND
ncbi:MAG: preprotein translocase subunit YajC [Sphingomicrobium sp.]